MENISKTDIWSISYLSLIIQAESKLANSLGVIFHPQQVRLEHISIGNKEQRKNAYVRVQHNKCSERFARDRTGLSDGARRFSYTIGSRLYVSALADLLEKSPTLHPDTLSLRFNQRRATDLSCPILIEAVTSPRCFFFLFFDSLVHL